MRLFLAVNGTWFFRTGLMFWVFLTGGVGINWETFSGPFLITWNFGQYLIPIVVLELYFLTQKQKGVSGKFLMAGALIYRYVAASLVMQSIKKLKNLYTGALTYRNDSFFVYQL
jgi:hypothetical protein